ncbi:hypothetical protein WA158_004989 [Blastocystis sp. Blastoise]
MNFLFFAFFLFSASAFFCGRYSDDCSTIPGQDVDYVIYSNAFGEVYRIEMQNVQPADSTCGENHNYGLIWTYQVLQTLGTRQYLVHASDVAFISYNLNSTTHIDCGVPIQAGVQISLCDHNCTSNGYNYWKDFPSYLHTNSTYTFELDEKGNIHFGRSTYTYVNADGCPLGVNDNTQTIIIIVVVFCVILLVLVFVYIFNKKAVKTLAGEKTKLFKQDKKQIKTKKAGDIKKQNENKKEKEEKKEKEDKKEIIKPKVVHI